MLYNIDFDILKQKINLNSLVADLKGPFKLRFNQWRARSQDFGSEGAKKSPSKLSVYKIVENFVFKNYLTLNFFKNKSQI